MCFLSQSYKKLLRKERSWDNQFLKLLVCSENEQVSNVCRHITEYFVSFSISPADCGIRRCTLFIFMCVLTNAVNGLQITGSAVLNPPRCYFLAENRTTLLVTASLSSCSLFSHLEVIHRFLVRFLRLAQNHI
jgi:hypothetical protein